MPLKIERSPYVVKASINREKAKNAVNFKLMDRLEELLDQLESDQETRLFVLTGNGDSFISGGDLREFHQLKKADEAKQMTRRMIHILERIKELPFWTLSAINGFAYGGGWEVASFFDFRIAIKNARIGFTQGKFYLPPGWGGISLLADMVGENRALYWLASQKVISAGQALEAGYLHDVFEESVYDQKLDQLISRLTLNDRAFIEYLKQSLSFDDVSQEIEPFSRFWESKEHQKRVDAFLDRK